MIWRWLDFCENRCCANCFEGQPMRRVQFAAKANSLFDISSKKRHLSTRWGKNVRQVQNSTRNLIFYIKLVPYDFRFSRKSAILLLLAEACGTAQDSMLSLRAPDVWHTCCPVGANLGKVLSPERSVGRSAVARCLTLT